MTDSKKNILARITASGIPGFTYPEFGFDHLVFADKEQEFIEQLKAAGGEAVVMQPGETLDDLIRRCYPDAKSVASALEEVTLRTMDPNEVDDPRKLVDVDLGVVHGAFGVAENGAVWIAQDIRFKSLYFGATSLMIVIPRDALVDTMHDAIVRPEMDDFGFGCFMSGPSKTADIEQAMVFGAHGPMSVTVVLR